MKGIISILLKIGIPVGILYLAFVTNPAPALHKTAIENKVASLKNRDIFGQADDMIRSRPSAPQGNAPMNYHDYFVASKVTDAEGTLLSFGFFQRVFVTKSEL
jgi:hypothetical protein